MKTFDNDFILLYHGEQENKFILYFMTRDERVANCGVSFFVFNSRFANKDKILE